MRSYGQHDELFKSGRPAEFFPEAIIRYLFTFITRFYRTLSLSLSLQTENYAFIVFKTANGTLRYVQAVYA